MRYTSLTMEWVEKEQDQAEGMVAEAAEMEPIPDRGLLDEMVRAGVLFGRKSSVTHPRMSRFIEMTRNGTKLFEHTKVLAAIETAGAFLEEVARKGGTILFVGATPPAREFVRAFSARFGFPSVTERWLGGTLTNFPVIAKRAAYYVKLKDDHEAGRLDQYTKRERVQFGKEIERMKKLFSGIERLVALPQTLFVVNAVAHMTAIREARQMRIPVVAVANSDANPDTISYLIPANDRARGSFSWVCERLASYIERGKSAREAVSAPGASTASHGSHGNERTNPAAA